MFLVDVSLVIMESGVFREKHNTRSVLRGHCNYADEVTTLRTCVPDFTQKAT